MAYKPLEIKLQPTGLNLLAPGDAVPEGDCLDLDGFWPGAVGKLEQAPGYTPLSALHLGANFDSVCQTSGRTYFGGGGAIYQVGRAAEAAIDTGYDGYPLGLLGYQNYCWVINRNRQRKDDGSTVSDWTPAAPGRPTLTNSALLNGPLVVAELDPANPDSNGDWTQINLYTHASRDGIEVGSLITIMGASGGSSAMNGTWLVTAVYDGSPNLIQLQAPLDAATVFTVAGGISLTWANPGMPLGDYSYWITWQYTDLGESNPSSSGGVITAATITVIQAGTYTNVDIGPLLPAPAGVVGWNIYRQSATMASAYRLNENVLPLFRTFVYDYGDSVHRHDEDYLVNGLGVIMEGDHDPAPAARIIANQVYNGRIVVANSADHPNRVWYTPSLQPSFFRGSGNNLAGDWVDIGTDRGDEIRFLAVKPGQIIVYRAKSIWRILGDFGDANSRIDVIVPDLGVVGPRAVVCTSLGDYFRAPEGIYKFNGDWAQKLSAKLDPIFRGLDVGALPAGGAIHTGENLASQNTCALGYRAGRLWVSYASGGGTFNNDCFILHVETNRWFNRELGVGAFLDTGSGFLGASLYYVLNLETGYIDVSFTIVRYMSGYLDCDMPDHEKTWADLVINHYTGGQTLGIRILTNKGITAADVFDLETTLTSSALTKTVVPLVYPAAYPVAALRGLPIRSYNLSIRITGVGPNAAPGLSIETPLVIHYYLEARKGRVFDTDETDHGMPGVTKTVDMVEFDIDNPSGAGILQIYADIPGGVMTPQLGAGAGIAQTTGRQTVRIVLGTPVDGKLLRYVATTLTGFSVYGFRARITPIGVYVDGSIAETWDTRPMPIAG